MIALHDKDFTWNRGCSSNSPPLKHGDQIPHPLEDYGDQISSSPGRQRCQMPGVCPGGGACWSFDLTDTFEFNARALKQSVREFYCRASLFVAPHWGTQKRAKQLLQLRPRPIFGSFGVVLMSCKVNFHVVRSALQNSVSLLSVYFCWSDLL